MPVRNLSLCVIDDREVIAEAAHLDVTIVRRFADHINDAFARKDVEIDLLSADINFSEDGTDPAGANRDSDSFGLTHFVVMAMRRRQSDAHRNILPFAWEIRTASPGEFRSDAHALRVYGLIRAAVARPRGEETLQSCLWREYEERFSGKTPEGFSEEKWLQQTPAQALRSDLTAQNQEKRSHALECAKHLLSEWRRQFLIQVKGGECRVAVDRLRRCITALDGLDELDYDNPKHRPFLIIPIADESGKSQYDLNLFSVMTDLLDPGVPHKLVWRCDTAARKWIDDLEEAARGGPIDMDVDREFAIKMIEPYRLIEEDLEEREARKAAAPQQRMVSSEKKVRNKLQEHASRSFERPYHKGMLLCFLTALSVIRELPTSVGEIEQTFALEGTHDQYWRRSIKSNKSMFVQLTPAKVVARIAGALKGSEADAKSLGATWDWLRPGLLRWLNRTATESDKKLAKKNARGLFNQDATPSIAAPPQQQSDIT